MTTRTLVVIGLVAVVVAALVEGIAAPTSGAMIGTAILAALGYVSGVGCGRRVARGEWSMTYVVMRFAIVWVVVSAVLMLVVLGAAGIQSGPRGNAALVLGVAIVLASFVYGLSLGTKLAKPS